LGLDFVIVKMWKSAAGQQLLESVAGGGLGASTHIFSTHARTNSSKACAWEKLDALRLFQAAKSFRGRPPATPGQIQELSKIIDLVKIQQYCSAQFPFDFYDP